jgi:hypothetical protein
MNINHFNNSLSILSQSMANDPLDPLGHKLQPLASSLSELPLKSGSMFTFEEYCVMAVGAACVGVALYQLNNIYFASRSLSPTFYEMLEELYGDQRNSLRRLHFPIINMPKAVG